MRFVVSEIEESKDFTRNEIPSGFYHVCVTDVDFTPTKTGAGEVFKINFGIIAPDEQKGQGLTAFIIYSHTSQAAVRIGHAALADLLFVLQVPEFSSVHQLRQLIISKELIIEVVNEDTEDGIFSRISDYWSRGGKHRSADRALKEVKLIKTGKLIQRKSKSSSSSSRADF